MSFEGQLTSARMPQWFCAECSVLEIREEKQTALKTTFSFQRDIIPAGNAAGDHRSLKVLMSQTTGSFKGQHFIFESLLNSSFSSDLAPGKILVGNLLKELAIRRLLYFTSKRKGDRIADNQFLRGVAPHCLLSPTNPVLTYCVPSGIQHHGPDLSS